MWNNIFLLVFPINNSHYLYYLFIKEVLVTEKLII